MDTSVSSTSNEFVLSNCIDLIKKCSFPRVNCPDEGLADEDFSKNKLLVKQCLTVICIQVLSETNCSFAVEHPPLVAQIMLICGEHSKLCPWSTKETVTLSEKILQKLCVIFKCSLEELLCDVRLHNDEKIIVKLLLCELRSKLTKTEWKHYPTAVTCYEWVIQNIKFPCMDNLTHDVFPATLNILDDFTIEYKILGLRCLNRMIHNMTSYGLHEYCSTDVLFNTLKPLLYLREPDLIVPLVECILTILEKSEHGSSKKPVSLKWSQFFDVMLKIVLPVMEFEQDISLRQKYIEALYIMINHPRVGLGIGRWSERLISVVCNYIPDENCSLVALNVLRIFLTKCHPLIPYVGRSAAIVVGRTVAQTSSNISVREVSEECYSILHACLSSKIKMPTLQEIREERMKK